MENKETNTVNIPTGKIPGYPVNDTLFRILLTPVFGIAIPLITGMINSQNFSNWEVKLSFLYTIMIAFVVWQGNRYLHFSLRTYFDWINKPLQKIGILILTIVFYSVPISVILLIGWYRLFTNDPLNWDIITQSTLIILIAVIFITHIYETVFLVKESETELIKREQLQRAKAEAELEALKNQIDPHFIFNSLNTLSYLIEEKPLRAKQFNDTLADVYRYILQNKSRNLVLLREEIEFVKSYFFLLSIRFDKAVELDIGVSNLIGDEYLVPPISLQLLLENAIKHNEFSDELPLKVKISFSENTLSIHNKIRMKFTGKQSSKIGLPNLRERYKLITDENITITSDDENFIVQIPLLKIS